jgi:hypothetical protein
MATFVVSPQGDDANPGTVDAPFLTIKRGLEALTGGDVLVLRGGSYAENVKLTNLSGRPDAPIVIRPWAREEVTIDGADPRDKTGPPSGFPPGWQHVCIAAALGDPEAHPDEYVSKDAFPREGEQDNVDRGAFVDLARYTRLITYSRIEDLRATNRTFGRLPVEVGPEPCLPALSRIPSRRRKRQPHPGASPRRQRDPAVPRRCRRFVTPSRSARSRRLSWMRSWRRPRALRASGHPGRGW